MKRVLIFGDSYTSGENNNYKSFADYLEIDNCEVQKIGVSGSCFGEYSIYPVVEQSLIYQIKKNEEAVKNADVILLEYGINDAVSVISGYVSTQQVIISFIKCLDYLNQLNRNAEIFFLNISYDYNFWREFNRLYDEYLQTDYFKGVDIKYSKCTLVDIYLKILQVISSKLPIITLIKEFDNNLIDSDGIHPNYRGYMMIANKLKEKLYEKWNCCNNRNE